MLTLVLWQRVLFLCVSRALFRMSLVMAVRRMRCIKRIVRNVIFARFGFPTHVLEIYQF